MLAANMLIGLREGLEASIVVMILVAFLVKSGNRSSIKWVWSGVAAAIAVVLGAFAVISFGTKTLSTVGQELLGGIASIVAVLIVTGMVVWMKKAARTMSTQLRGSMSRALDVGPVAVITLAFISVAREGLETLFLVFDSVLNFRVNPVPLVGVLLGIVVAVLLTVAMYFGTVSINLSKFFTVTGALLIFVAAGILRYGITDLQEANVLPGLHDLAFDATSIIEPGTWYHALLSGILNIVPDPTVLAAVAWTLYLVIVLPLFFLHGRSSDSSPDASASETAQISVTNKADMSQSTKTDQTQDQSQIQAKAQSQTQSQTQMQGKSQTESQTQIQGESQEKGQTERPATG